MENHFAEYIAAGPTARNLFERRCLLRYANDVAVTHSQTALARRPESGDRRRVLRTFDCECAAPTCDAVVHVPVSDAAAALAYPPPALLAPGHLPPIQ